MGLAGVLAAGTGPAVQAQTAVRWRLASSFPKSLDVIFDTTELFARKVNEMSGGKFTISVHAAREQILQDYQTQLLQLDQAEALSFPSMRDFDDKLNPKNQTLPNHLELNQ
jgi:TRAP-type mannitol/chloroaromatic compound transport system substrate-binding protein